MGQAVSRLTRPIRNFNIENRASRTLERTKEVPNPAHETTQKPLSKFREEHPELLDTVTVKNDNLHDRLKHIYVDSKDAPIEIKSTTTPKPLSRRSKPDTDLGVMDITYDVPEGKAQLKTVLQFIGQNQLNPDQHTAASIAEAHSLNKADVDNILKHFYALQIYLPKEMHEENKNLKKIMDKQAASGSPISAFQPKLQSGSATKESKVPEDGLSPNKTS